MIVFPNDPNEPFKKRQTRIAESIVDRFDRKIYDKIPDLSVVMIEEESDKSGIKALVQGSKKNAYVTNVSVTGQTSCTCHDFRYRRKDCKHIFLTCFHYIFK